MRLMNFLFGRRRDEMTTMDLNDDRERAAARRRSEEMQREERLQRMLESQRFEARAIHRSANDR